MEDVNAKKIKWVLIILGSVRSITTAVIFIVIAIFLLTRWQIPPFYETLKPVINFFLWIAFVGVIYFLIGRWFLKNSSKATKNTSISDAGQAKEVLQYFQDKCELRKALMLIAPWGAGKTEFCKVSLNPLLEKRFSRKLITVSCFGISSTNDLSILILNKLYRVEILTCIISQLSQFLSSTSYFKQTLIPENCIIFLDDFERFSGRYIDMLGFIDYLINEKKCHIIILCDEGKIRTNEQYKEFSEKVVSRYYLEMSREQMKNIMCSEKFMFSNEEYFFSESIVAHFLTIVSSTRNLRNAYDAHVDLKNFTEQLFEKIKDFDISEEDRGKILKNYFQDACSGVIKAAFIKNMGKEEEYLEYREKIKKKEQESSRKNSSGQENSQEKEIKLCEFLQKLGAEKLSEGDLCIVESKLWLPPSLEEYLKFKGAGLHDAYINEVVLDFILLPNILLKIDANNDANNDAGNDIERNIAAIKVAFFIYFEFIQWSPLTVVMQYTLLVYKVFELKKQLKLEQKELALINKLERMPRENSPLKSTQEDLIEMSKNLMEGTYPPPWECFNKIDPGMVWLKKWQKNAIPDEQTVVLKSLDKNDKITN